MNAITTARDASRQSARTALLSQAALATMRAELPSADVAFEPIFFQRHQPRLGYEALVASLHDVARQIEAQTPGADACLRGVMAELDGHLDPRCVGLYVFAAGLARRLDGVAVEQANLYLSQFEMPQIHLFNLLGRAVPFVGLATRLCNEAIMKSMQGQARPTLIDVGIGTGRQACALLESMAAAHCLPALLTVIGIEPSDWALHEAQQTIEQTAARLGARVSFFGIVGTAEDMSPRDWRRVAQACTARPVVNASFALHHIGDGIGGLDQRNPVLAQLHALNPELLVLAEPDVDHLQRHFYRRFANCFAHFSAVFRTMDALPLTQSDRDALKVGFFGREIADILGTPEGQRSERHESASSWSRRLRATGFDLTQSAQAPALEGGVVGLSQREGHLTLDFEGESVVAIFTAQPMATGKRAGGDLFEALLY